MFQIVKDTQVIDKVDSDVLQSCIDDCRWGNVGEYEVQDISAQVTKEKAIAEAKAYLDSTDYMVVRIAEGYTLPDDVKAKREAARIVIRNQ